jgi:hypothetical protein
MPDYPKETRDPIANVWVSVGVAANFYARFIADVHLLRRQLQGERTPYHGEGQWPVRVDEHIEAPVEKWVQSACKLETKQIRV